MTTARRVTSLTVPLALLQPALAAVIPAASRDVARPVLTAVHIAFSAGTVTIEATDSYRIHQVKAIVGPIGDDPFDVMLDAAWLKSMLWPATSVPDFPSVDIKRWARADAVTVTCADRSWTGPTVGGKYPDTSKIIAEHIGEDEGVSAFNPKYLADAMKAGGKWAGEYLPIEVHALNPMKPCHFKADREVPDVAAAQLTIVLMPVRTRSPLRKAS